MIKKKVGLTILVVGSLTSSLVFIDFALKGLTVYQGFWASVAWITSIFMFIIGYKIIFLER